MVITPLSLSKDYWDTFKIQETDLEFLYNHLMEIEKPQTILEITQALITQRIKNEKKLLESRQKATEQVYLPKVKYKVGQTILFPQRDYQPATVLSIRQGNNPDLPPFEVIEVLFKNGEKSLFASNLEKHNLNQPSTVNLDDQNLNIDFVVEKYGNKIIDHISRTLKSQSDLVCVADHWFLKALLVDVNIGHLNLAEAILDMEGGGPLSTPSILKQLELISDVNPDLIEFSLNYALHQDPRFDDVGPTGETHWFLHRLEPIEVQQTPEMLKYSPLEYNPSVIQSLLLMFEGQIIDEYEPEITQEKNAGETISISLIYPHWRTGTLPLVGRLNKLFPTAKESPRVKFTFIDNDNRQEFSGWAIRPSHYVFGLKEWYRTAGLIPGSIIFLQKANNSDEILIRADRRRPGREWIRTVTSEQDGTIIFTMRKQLINAAYNERMAIYIPEVEDVDHAWENTKTRSLSLEQTVITMMRELSKLTPQGHVNAQELYAAVNVIRRCPPGPILDLLVSKPWSKHLGDLYFRLSQED